MKEKLKSGVPIDDVCETYSKHKQKFQEENKFEAEAWKDARYSFDKKFDPFNTYYASKTYQDKYNIHNVENVIDDIRYWDTKENDEYYSLSRWKRLKLFVVEKISNLPIEFYVFNILFLFMVAYYAKKKSRQFIS